jgi:hypothetical protein
MKRQVSYQWRLRETMAAAGMFAANDLEPHLRDRGITLSSVQVWRLVTQTPERLSLPVLAALCDIFDCPTDLIATKAANWEGSICRTCYAKAVRQRGRCPGCGTERLLPGRRPCDGAPICRDCAGITRDFFCGRCGFEGELHGGRLCTRCTSTARLNELLDDGTGRIHPQLAPLVDAVVGMPEPLTGLKWLRSTIVRGLLRDLAAGRVPITHEALKELPNQQAVAYLRDLLMTSGVLPTVDKQLLHAESLLQRKLTDHADHPHHRILRQFALWHQLPRLRRRARRGPVTDGGRYYVGSLSHEN